MLFHTKVDAPKVPLWQKKSTGSESLKKISIFVFRFCDWLTFFRFSDFLSAFFYSKFNPLKNRSIINSYIYSFLFFLKNKRFFCSSSKFPKIALNFKEYFLKLFNINIPNLLRFQSMFMESIFQKIQILKQVQMDL